MLHLPHNAENLQISNKIFIRDCYRTLVKLLLNSKDKKNVLIGTPGIGKSHFALYFVYKLIKHGIPFVFDTDYNEDKENFFLLKSDGNLVCKSVTAIKDELNNQLCWYVVDGREPRDFSPLNTNLKCFYIDTSKASKLKKHLERSMDSSIYHFPCWTLDEIKECNYIIIKWKNIVVFRSDNFTYKC